MAVLKCEKCGAMLKSEEGKFTATCEYCGVEMTIFESTAEFEVDSRGTLVQYNGKGGDVVLPENIIKIGDEAFKGNERVFSVKLPESVKEIGSYAFSGCSELEEINLPDGLECLGDHAFFECTSLKEIKVPDGILSLKKSVFCDCHSLQKVELPDGIRKFEDRVFGDCKKLKAIKLPAKLKSMGDRCFYECIVLEEIELPDTVESMGTYNFAGCTLLKSVNIPSALSVLPDNTFYRCPQLGSIHIPSNILSIGFGAFSGCTGLKTVTLEEGLTDIASLALYNCSSIEGTLVLPQSLKSIASIPGTKVTELVIGDVLEKLSHLNGSFPHLQKVTLLEGIKEIPKCAFYNCKQITSIEIPESVEVIGESAFDYCTALKEVKFRNFENSKLVKILNEAFESCKSLESIALPRSVREISDNAFRYCDALRIVRISEGCEKIGAEAFQNTDGRSKQIYLPSSIKEIGADAFYTWEHNDIYSPRNEVIENVCDETDNCTWHYVKSEAEIRAEQERARIEKEKAEFAAKQAAVNNQKNAIAKAKSDLEKAIKNKSAAEGKIANLNTSLAEKEQLLTTLTGIFAGGKRRKCEEEIAFIKSDLTAQDSLVKRLEKEIKSLNSQIPSMETKLQQMISELE